MFGFDSIKTLTVYPKSGGARTINNVVHISDSFDRIKCDFIEESDNGSKYTGVVQFNMADLIGYSTTTRSRLPQEESLKIGGFRSSRRAKEFGERLLEYVMYNGVASLSMVRSDVLKQYFNDDEIPAILDSFDIFKDKDLPRLFYFLEQHFETYHPDVNLGYSTSSKDYWIYIPKPQPYEQQEDSDATD